VKAFVFCAVALLTVSLWASARQIGARTTAGGVFTAAQASRGRAAYVENCLKCHQKDLKGIDDAPPLVGHDFLVTWEQPNTLRDLFTKICVSMPDDLPGSLSDATCVDLLAFILQQNGMPVGREDLTLAGLRDVVITEIPDAVR
jgi:cytochrome c553